MEWLQENIGTILTVVGLITPMVGGPAWLIGAINTAKQIARSVEATSGKKVSNSQFSKVVLDDAVGVKVNPLAKLAILKILGNKEEGTHG